MRDRQFRRYQKYRVANKYRKMWAELVPGEIFRAKGTDKTNPFTCGVPGCRYCCSARQLYGNSIYARTFAEQRSLVSLKEWLDEV